MANKAIGVVASPGTTYFNGQRFGEVPNANWTTGLGKDSGLGLKFIGFSTYEWDNKPQDWGREVIDLTAQLTNPAWGPYLIGWNALGPDEGTIGGRDLGGTVRIGMAYVQADADTAPDAVLDVTTGVINRSPRTVPAGAWIWGVS